MSPEIDSQWKAVSDEPEYRKVAFNALLTAQATVMLAVFGATFTYYLNMSGETISSVFSSCTLFYVGLTFIGNAFFASLLIAIMKAQRHLFLENYNPDLPPSWHIHRLKVWRYALKEPDSSISTDKAVQIITSSCIIALMINWCFFAIVTISYFNIRSECKLSIFG